MDNTFRSKIATGIMDYVSSGKHPLKPPQANVLEDISAHLEAGNDYGYIKRPTGTGKTVNYIAEVAALGMPALIVTPKVSLTTQIQKTFLDKSLFDFDPAQIGVYHSEIPEDQKSDALKAPILITTFASYARLSGRGLLSGRERPLVILDEVHHARGNVARALIKELLGDVYVQGWTATDTFITGQNIGYYLFNGMPPLHITTVPEAIANREITPYKNIIVETHLGTGIKVSGLGDYTNKQIAHFAMEAGRDEAAIRLFLELYDEETGLAFRDMNSIWYCAGVDHAERVAEKLTDIFGENYALAVSGQTPKKDLEKILDMHRNGEIPIIVNADLLIEGFDSPTTQLAMMLRLTRSPIVAEQTGGRILRVDSNNPDKVGYIVTLIDEGMYDVIPFGAVAGNMAIMKNGALHENTNIVTNGNNGIRKYYDFPEISGMEVHTSQIALADFIKRREEYLGLRKNGQPLEPASIAKIVSSHKTYNGNASEAARHLPYSSSTIAKHWKNAGLRVNGVPGRNLEQQEIDRIVTDYSTYKGNATEAARHLPYSSHTISKHWENAGFKSHGRTLTEEDIKRIVAAHKTYGGNTQEAAKHLPYSTTAILEHWKDADLETKVHSLTPEQIKGVLDAHKTYNGKASTAAKHLPYDHKTIAAHWKDAGLKTLSRGEHNRATEEQIAEIVSAHPIYEGSAYTASQHLPFSHKTIAKYWRLAGKSVKEPGWPKRKVRY